MRVSPRFREFVFCLALGAGLSVLMEQDASWDLRNYHLYNPVNLLQGRFDLDFFPADKQTGNNPLPDLIYTFLALGPLAHFPRIVAAVMGFWYGLLVFVSLRLAVRLFAPIAQSERRILLPLATLTAVTGAMAVSQIGSTSNDIAVGVFILAGLLFVLRGEDDAGKAGKSLVLGGLLFGLSAGIKLTGGIYAPALVLALFATQPIKKALRSAVFFSGGWLAGFLASFGWWGWILWRRFANPVFPLFNAIFKSPLAPPLNLRDTRFLPQDAVQWFFYPFYWAFDSRRHPVYETDFRDPRMAIAYIALAALGVVAAYDFLRRRKDDILTPPQKTVTAFLIFSYATWLVASSILRYAVAVEILSALVASVVIMRLAPRFRRHLPPFAPLGIAVLVCVFCLVTTRHPGWDRRAFADRMFDVDMSWVPPDSLFIGVYEPIAYLAAFTPPELHARFVGLPFILFLQNTPLGENGKEMVHMHNGPIFVLVREERMPFLKFLPAVGLSPDVRNCRAIHADLSPPGSPPVLACEAVRQISE